jgi:hypothetical protein
VELGIKARNSQFDGFFCGDQIQPFTDAEGCACRLYHLGALGI